MGDTQETSATLESKAAGVRMCSKQPTVLCPRCSQPGTYSVPGFPPWPLFFWLLPTLLTPLLAPGVPLQQQMWLLEQRGHWLGNSGTQQWEQALCFALQGQWVGWAQPGQRVSSDRCLSQIRSLRHSVGNSAPEAWIRVLIIFFCLKVVQNHYGKIPKKKNFLYLINQKYVVVVVVFNYFWLQK